MLLRGRPTKETRSDDPLKHTVVQRTHLKSAAVIHASTRRVEIDQSLPRVAVADSSVEERNMDDQENVNMERKRKFESDGISTKLRRSTRIAGK